MKNASLLETVVKWLAKVTYLLVQLTATVARTIYTADNNFQSLYEYCIMKIIWDIH